MHKYISPPLCASCKHFDLLPSVKPVCAAFPNGIPKTIWSGGKQHEKPLLKQGNSLVYEKIQSPFF